jgi:hypothetical protein
MTYADDVITMTTSMAATDHCCIGGNIDLFENNVRRQSTNEALIPYEIVALCVHHKEYLPLNQIVVADCANIS